MTFFVVFVIVVVVIIALANSGASRRRPSHRRTPITPQPSVRPKAHVRTKRHGRGVTLEIVIDDGRASTAKEEPLRSDSESFWRSFTSANSVHGYSIGGGVYLGRNLGAPDGWSLEPALIDETLPVDLMHPNRKGEGVDYWPSYSDISPASRAGYLEWLAGGRSNPDAYIGYVFLYFYGLERRFFIDSKTSPAARMEQPLIQKEVERLLSIYAISGSFRGYATGFLEAARVLAAKGHVHEIPPAAEDRFGIPLSLRIALGEFASTANAVPPEWVLAWLRATSPSMRRIPVERSREEFDRLFSIRYAQSFGAGVILSPGPTKITASYRAASATLRTIELDLGNLPDIVSSGAPPPKLEKLAEDCANDLEAYSRWLGKNRNGRRSVAAIGLLPSELTQNSDSTTAQALKNILEARLNGSASTVIDADQLLAHWPCTSPPKLKKSEAVLLAQALQKMGYGIEPDVRFGGKTLDSSDHVAVFRLAPDAQAAPSSQFPSAAMLLQLATVVSNADGVTTQEERRTMEEHIADSLLLSDVERMRISARLEWLLQSHTGTTRLKKQIEKLSESQRAMVGNFLVRVATADGQVLPSEIDALRKIYKLLGLSPEDVYGDVHAAAAEGREPVSIVPERPSAGFRIPQRETTPLALDSSLIERKLAETAQVSALLSGIFSEDEEHPAPQFVQPAVAVSNRAVSKLGLHHAALMQALATRPEWTRAEMEHLASDVALLLDGALEKLNDFAFNEVGEPFWEGDDVVQINQEVASQLAS